MAGDSEPPKKFPGYLKKCGPAVGPGPDRYQGKHLFTAPSQPPPNNKPIDMSISYLSLKDPDGSKEAMVDGGAPDSSLAGLDNIFC